MNRPGAPKDAGPAALKPLVSVIIPTFNRAWALPAALRSVVEQTYRPIECIVVDDGSTDNTAEVVARVACECPADLVITRVAKTNGGANSARNRGLALCTGDLICYLDSDDSLPTDSIQQRVQLLIDNPDSGFAYGRTAVRDAAGALRRVMNEPWPDAGEARIARYLFVGSAPLVRRSLCEQVGPWRDDDPFGQEYEYFARLKYACNQASFTYKVVSHYTKHGRDHLFDGSLAFAHANHRMLMAVGSLVLASPRDTPAERRALAVEYARLGLRLYRLKDCIGARYAMTTALRLAPSPRRLARSFWYALCASLRAFLPLPAGGRRDTVPPPRATARPPLAPRAVAAGAPAMRDESDVLPPPGADAILAWWSQGYNNWGDVATPFIVGALTGRDVRRGHGPGCIYAVGSIVNNVRAGGHLWGCGLLSRRHVPTPFPPEVTVHAVRGPLTRRALQRAGVTVPAIYGDPVMLLPYLLRSDIRPRTGIGVICNYLDAPYLGELRGTRSCRIIDIQAGFREVLEAVMDCESIVSTSLHGLILAEAYGKPTAWLQLDRGRHLVGRSFKFKDYLAATQRATRVNSIRQGQPVPLDRLEWLPPPKLDLQRLVSVFPGASGLTLQGLRPRALESL